MDFALKFLSILFTTSLLVIAEYDRLPTDAESSDNVLHYRLRAKVLSLDLADVDITSVPKDNFGQDLSDMGTKAEIVTVNPVIRKQIAIENLIFERKVKL